METHKSGREKKIIAVEARVYGRVQGVSFRDATRRQAEDLALAGFVRNESDGSVYVFAEGDEVAVGRLLDWCRQGPPRARVTHVNQTTAAITGRSGFRIEF